MDILWGFAADLSITVELTFFGIQNLLQRFFGGCLIPSIRLQILNSVTTKREKRHGPRAH